LESDVGKKEITTPEEKNGCSKSKEMTRALLLYNAEMVVDLMRTFLNIQACVRKCSAI